MVNSSSVFGRGDADDRGAIFQREEDGFETRSDHGIRSDDRLQQVSAIVAGGDPGEIRADIPAFAFDLVAAETGRLGLLIEDLPAELGVAAFEAFAPCGEVIGGIGALLFVRSELLLHGGIGALRGGFEKIELERRGDFAGGHQAIDPLAQRLERGFLA